LHVQFGLLFLIKHHLPEKWPAGAAMQPVHPSMDETHSELGNMKDCMVVNLTCTHCDGS
jgi:hypothetical protein